MLQPGRCSIAVVLSLGLAAGPGCSALSVVQLAALQHCALLITAKLWPTSCYGVLLSPTTSEYQVHVL